jgi:dTDP-4-amino-4,6-dideoxygalactose transaminase
MTVAAVVPLSTSVPFCVVDITPDARAAAARALRTGWITTGPEVAAFEDEFAATVGARHAVAVSSCTAALQLALRALELPPGSRVLTPSMTFAGAVHAILQAGFQPVLVDIDPVTLMPAPEHVAAAAARGPRPGAMVVLHYGGAPADIFALADAAGLPMERVVEDAAHALWTRIPGGRDVGTLSAATCFSFYATKNLPLGEGGMITTESDLIASHVRRARLHGMSKDAWRRYLPGGTWRYDIEVAGIKANMTDVTAAMGRAQLCHLPAWQRRREQIAARYRRALAGVAGIRLPGEPDGGRHAWHLFVVQIERESYVNRDLVAAHLEEMEIGCSVHFIPVHQLRYFRDLLGDHAGLLPGTDKAADRVLSLPMHPRLSDADVDRVCEAVVDSVMVRR